MRDQPFSYQGVFAVVDESGEQIARLSSGVYTAIGVESRGYPDTVRIEDGVATLYKRGADPIGVIEGLTLTMHGGQVLTLRPQPHESNAGTARRLDDPDAFRAALECFQMASDGAQPFKDIDALCRRIEGAAFYRCPACENAPCLVTACKLCGGDGFVNEGVVE